MMYKINKDSKFNVYQANNCVKLTILNLCIEYTQTRMCTYYISIFTEFRAADNK